MDSMAELSKEAEEKESWKEVPDKRGVFVSNLGRCYREACITKTQFGNVIRTTAGFIKSPVVYVGGKQCTVAALVAETWIGPKPESGFVVRRKNNEPDDLRVENLFWGRRGNGLTKPRPQKCMPKNTRIDLGPGQKTMADVPAIEGLNAGEERWKLIPKSENFYVSNMGRVCRLENNKVTFFNRDWVKINGREININNLIAEAWIGPSPSKNLVARTKDGNRANKHPDNLVWACKSPKSVPDRCFGKEGKRVENEHAHNQTR